MAGPKKRQSDGRKSRQWDEELIQEIERAYVRSVSREGRPLSLHDVSNLYDVPFDTVRHWSATRNWGAKRELYLATVTKGQDIDAWSLQPVVQSEVRRQLHSSDAVDMVREVSEDAVDREVDARIKPAMEYIRQHLNRLDDLSTLGTSLVAIAARLLPTRQDIDEDRVNWTPSETLRALQLGKDILFQVIEHERRIMGLPDHIEAGTYEVKGEVSGAPDLTGVTVKSLTSALKELGVVEDIPAIDAEFDVESDDGAADTVDSAEAVDEADTPT